MTPTIEVQALTRTFKGVPAVDQVSFTVEPGEVFGLLGPNGAGKTTLVRLLNGLLAPTGGSASVFGLDAARNGEAIRQRTGVLTETPSLYERLPARENLHFFGAMYNVPEKELKPRIDKLLKFFELDTRAGDRPGGFSKGMKQRLALARALLHNPELLFFDEPTSGLDPEAARSVDDLIYRLSRESGRTVMLCTHNLEEAQRLCTRIGVINRGKLLAFGTPAELARDLWQGTWVDVTLAAAPAPELVSAVKGLRGVLNASVGGAQLAVQVETEAGIPAVIAGIVNAGGQIMKVMPREYSLEAIYFKVQEGES
jgi:ABC-2 type transport system ATP-binding protein